MFKAVLTDLDGTLLDSNHELTDFTRNIMKKFISKGYKLYIATGRIEMGAKRITDKIDTNISVVTINGARTVDKYGKELNSIFLDEYSNKFLLDFDYEKYGNDIYVNGYCGNEWYIVNNEQLPIYFKNRIDDDYRPKLISNEEFKKYRYNKIYFIGNLEKILEIKKVLDEKIGDRTNINIVGKNSVEIYSKEINKAKSSKLLLDIDNIKEDEVVVFGDGFNDFDMLNYFKNSYVMGNASKELKNKLLNREVIGNNDSDAVAKKIIEIFEL
ncbi:HAD family hydrolase [Oceanivirga salmonicida]|uniref:HAD family hydrolase n=1 Tax=Oceanivirga salmonicida TaxID=1769291 RepID=UPI0012E2493A|nr:HAD family hydrolase [Oceanivirga salmonicida]